MVQTVKRRQATVQAVQQLINGINFIRAQKQISNLDRLTRYMEREHGMKRADAEKQLHYAVLDNLIHSYTGVGFKGTKTGVEYEGFRLPDQEDMEMEDDGHDWYCFECHSPGEMYACSDCWRVFHPDCQDEDTDDISYLCAVCKSARKKKKTKRKLLNTLLSYTIVRLKEKTRELHRIGHREEERQNMPMFVYKAMDLNKMEQKVMAHKYKCIEEFLADAHNVLHNMVLIYGDEVPGGMTELAKIMIRDCKYDIDEMAQCQNCYYMSNAKPSHWFAQPCDPPHELVYAKLKGYSYWPAKVIHYMSNDRYDVRFFGGLHQRAVIPKDQIKPIDIDIKKVSMKKTAGFQKAEQELAIHKKLLQERKDAEQDEEEEEEEEVEERPRKKHRRSVIDHAALEGDEEEKESKERKEKSVARRSNVQPESEDDVAAHTPRTKHKKKRRSTRVEPEDLEEEVDVRDIYEEVPGDSETTDRQRKRKRRTYDEDIEDNVTSTSTTKRSKTKKVSSPDDTVTSTGEYLAPTNKRPRLSTSTTASQTSNNKVNSVTTSVNSTQTDVSGDAVTDRLTVPGLDDPPRLEVGEDKEGEGESKPCPYDGRCPRLMVEQRDRLEKAHQESKQKALDELSERLQKDFEEDKQQAVARAMGKLQTELERVRRQTEEKCKEQYKDEMKKLAQKHKETISATKKKQWCYNCEEEAMYHCCWNTSYCSVKCQQEHWHKEHKRVCRRKR